MEHAVDVYDIEHVIVDNLQFMMGLEYGPQGDRFLKQDMIVAKFRKFATNKNCHVSLVIHPRKEKETEALTTASIFGSAKATQEADNVMLLQDKRLQSPRDNRKYIQITKNRFDGDLGIVELNFDKETFCYTRDVEEKTITQPHPALRHDSHEIISPDCVNNYSQIEEDSVDERDRLMLESLKRIREKYKWSPSNVNHTSIEQITGANILIPVDMTKDCDSCQ